MKLQGDEFKRFKALTAKAKTAKLTAGEQAELDALTAKRNSKGGNNYTPFTPGNDISWWNKVPELLKDASNIKPNYIAGTKILDSTIPFVVPGVLTIGFRTMYGSDRKSTDAINLWARDVYLKMFQKFRGISQYQAPDVGIAIIAAIEVLGMFTKLERIYGVVNRYKLLNVNMPRVEVEALGLNQTSADWIRGHLSDFRYDLNTLVRKAQKVCIPKNMSLLKDRVSLLGFEYKDHISDRAQIILFDTAHWGCYSDTAIATGSAVVYETEGDNYDLIDYTGSVDNMFPLLEHMVDSLIGSTAVQRIFADLMVWFGSEQMLTIMPLGEDYTLEPVYSETIMHKIHNLRSADRLELGHLIDNRCDSTVVSQLQAFGGNNQRVIYQVENCIVTKGTLYSPSGSSIYNSTSEGEHMVSTTPLGIFHQPEHVLDTYVKEFTEETVTEGCLFKFIPDYYDPVVSGTQYYGAIVNSAAFEVIVSITSYEYDPDNDDVIDANINQCSSVLNTARLSAALLTYTDWAPIVYYVNSSGSLAGTLYGELDNLVPVFGNQVARVHRACVLSGLEADLVVKSN